MKNFTIPNSLTLRYSAKETDNEEAMCVDILRTYSTWFSNFRTGNRFRALNGKQLIQTAVSVHSKVPHY